MSRNKSKPGCLSKLLSLAILIVLLNIGNKGITKYLENDINKFVQRYPFEFTKETDNLNNVTSNFKVSNSYELDENKIIKTKWTSSSDNIVFTVDGEAIVTRPKDKNQNVILTETYNKFGIFKAERTFNITLISEPNLTVEDIKVIDLNDISEGNYKKDMQAVLNEDNSLKYLMGDFNKLKVNSEEEALTVIKSYEPQFNINLDIEYRINKITNTNIKKNYIFNVYFNNTLLSNSSAILTTSLEDNSVTYISIDIEDINFNNDLTEFTPFDIDYFTIIDNYVKTTKFKDKSYIVIVDSVEIYKSLLCAKYNLIFNSGEICVIYLDRNGNVQDFIIKSQAILNSATMTKGNSFCDEHSNENVEFDCVEYKIGSLKNYYLFDLNRNISVLHNTADYTSTIRLERDDYKKTQDGKYTFDSTLLKLWDNTVSGMELLLGVNINESITSNTPTFTGKDKGVSKYEFCKVLSNIQHIYDWYYENFNYISYDNKNSEIKVLVDSKIKTGNACWNSLFNFMQVGSNSGFKHGFGVCLDILGHEFTHAVFGALNADSAGAIEIFGINEAYADIMGSLLSGNDWYMGDLVYENGNETYLRNLYDLQNEYMSQYYSSFYKDDNWVKFNGEEHTIATVISHIACKMATEGYFEPELVANIWFNSLGNYTKNSTYYDCRKYVIESAKCLGCSPEQIDYIAHYFDEACIFDSSYEFKTDLFKKPENIFNETQKTLKIKSNAISGDLMLDDDLTNKYLIVFSLARTILGDGEGIYLYQISNGASKENMTDLENRINEAVHNTYAITNFAGKEIHINYEQIDESTMNKYLKLLSSVDGYIDCEMDDEFINKMLEMTDEEVYNLGVMKRVVFSYMILDCTAYELFDKFNLIIDN